MKTIYFLSVILFLTSCSGDKSIFEVKQLGEMRADQILINKETGQLWKKVCMNPTKGECEYMAWMKEDIEDINISKDKILEISAALKNMSSEHKADEKKSDPFADFNPNGK